MKRKIIEIDEDLCNGCAKCVNACSEGALKMINGKAKLVREDFCDGLGACMGDCPTGALKIVEREAQAFDEQAMMKHNKQQTVHLCPGMQEKNSREAGITQWPIQLHLVNPNSNIFQARELVIVSTCAPLVNDGIKRTYLQDRAMVVACPKLDRTDHYVEKLTTIFSQISKVIILRMEVPCCGGLAMMALAAKEASGRKELEIEEHIIQINGSLKQIRSI